MTALLHSRKGDRGEGVWHNPWRSARTEEDRWWDEGSEDVARLEGKGDSGRRDEAKEFFSTRVVAGRVVVARECGIAKSHPVRVT